ncbi:hypothetical protein, partial [Methanomethylovorans sp.]|uniref:hypothetical protein n=1 Tax=Methanomethylovorans sp. TaxID=2758717 RepID=UPI00351C6AC0
MIGRTSRISSYIACIRTEKAHRIIAGKEQDVQDSTGAEAKRKMIRPGHRVRVIRVKREREELISELAAIRSSRRLAYFSTIWNAGGLV